MPQIRRFKWWVIVLVSAFVFLSLTWAQAQSGGIAYGQTASGTLTRAATQAATSAATAAAAANAGDIALGASARGELNDKTYSQLGHFRGNFADVLDISMMRQ